VNDTAPEIARRYRELLMSKTPEQRLRMGLAMYDTARALAESGIRAQYPDISPRELKKQLFLRFYGNDFSDRQKEKILRSLLAD